MQLLLQDEDVNQITERIFEKIKPLLVCKCAGKSEDVIYDVQGLADYLKVSKKWIYERTHLKEIPHYKKDGLLRFRKTHIDKWLDTYIVPVASKPTAGVMRVIKSTG